MRVVTSEEMARVEELAVKAGSNEELFMEKAGEGVAQEVRWLLAKFHLDPKITLFSGRGKNGGDAFVAGRLLLEGGFDVTAYLLSPKDKCHKLTQMQMDRFERIGGKILFVTKKEQISLKGRTLILDGILGTGFHGHLEGLYKEAIQRINESKIMTLAIDVPSGINGTTGELDGVAVVSAKTLFLGLPKAGCFLGKAWNYTGKVSTFNFGLPKEYLEQAKEVFTLLTREMVKPLVPAIRRTRHKYEAGYVVGLGGSVGMPGAPLLTAHAALRSGAGIVRLLHPKEMSSEFANAPLELIREGYENIEGVLRAMERASSLFVGPGIGTHEKTALILKEVLEKSRKPMVIDAEALTLIAEKDLSIPEEAILTPHVGEMKRLLKTSANLEMREMIERVQKFVEEKRVTCVLKGAPTFIFHPHRVPTISPQGAPGMATAGTGDVLTGVIAALLAQKMAPFDAARLGVWLHGIAGEIADERMTSYSMIASDIIDALHDAISISLL